MNDTTEFNEYFKKYLGFDFPLDINDNAELVIKDGFPILVTQIAKTLRDVPKWSMKELFDIPKGYYWLGMWGHGINSYRFVYVTVNEWQKIFLELSYFGAYTDGKKCIENIKNILNVIKEIESNKDKIKQIFMYVSFGNPYCKIEKNDGKIIEKTSIVEIKEFNYHDI